MLTSLLIVIGLLVVLQFASLFVITYLTKRIIDDKPIIIKETVAGPPQVLTRADNRAARVFQEEQNFKTKAEDKYADLADLPADMGMAELDKLYGREK